MVEKKLNNWKDTLEKKRFWILYVASMTILLISLAGWALLPNLVYVTAESMGSDPVAKNTALLSNLGLVTVFLALFTWKPRELVYFVALVLALLMSAIPLLNLVV